MSAGRVIFLNNALIETGVLAGRPFRRDYIAACRFMQCGMLDRTASLDLGFAYAILDPIPDPAPTPSFHELCDTIGAEIVADAIASDRSIRVMWSGGIDSTAALIAILRSATDRHVRDRIRVLMTLDSAHEYPRFFLDHLHGEVAIEELRQPVSNCIDPYAINVTGEHGDQLFGSHLLRTYVQRGIADEDYRDILPWVLLERLRSVRDARRASTLLQHVIDASPVPIITLFDCLWWLNFALKWQVVSLRLFATATCDAETRFAATRHFFRDTRFEQWSMSVASSQRCPPTWERYKDVAKTYIRQFTGDEDYFQCKEKEDSLRNIVPRSPTGLPVGMFMREDFRPVARPIVTSLRS